MLAPTPLPQLRAALDSLEAYLDAAKAAVTAMTPRHQYAEHGLAWIATYVEALRQTYGWAERLEAAGQLSEVERLIAQAGFGEYIAQLYGGLPMSQGEVLRPADLGIEDAADRHLTGGAAGELRRTGNTMDVRDRIAELIADGEFGAYGLGDETLTLITAQFRRFVDDAVTEPAHEWHLNNDFIPLDVVGKMAELGVFGLTVPEEDGGHGLGKMAMCVVSEELSRGYIGVGSLGTRSEIAAELIRLNGTPAQRAEWLPKIASGEILPTAVFTEPNIGSDLANLRTRAEKVTKDDGSEVYRITGQKTWITHGARSDVMTLLARTGRPEDGAKGVSMFIAPKPRGDDADPFPAEGMTGGEIEVLGYRGMKEYDISFDGFEVPADCLLGGEEGAGFKQLMQTFESARIQTAARALGVAQNAMELGLAYARDRIQFGKPIYDFPRVSGKLAWMAVETMVARQLTYFAAREKDLDKRSDMVAGMAKLLAARVAWSNADNALQVHGGNGYAHEYKISRVLCDARILNIFEGAAEIQAMIVARSLIGRGN